MSGNLHRLDQTKHKHDHELRPDPPRIRPHRQRRPLAAPACHPAFAQTDKTVTVAFVGVAHIHTPGFIDLLKKRPDVQIKYVWDHDAARAQNAPRKWTRRGRRT